MIIEKILMQASKVNDYVTKGRRQLDASLSLPSGKAIEDVFTQTWTGEEEVTADMNDGLAVITGWGRCKGLSNFLCKLKMDSHYD